MNGLSIMGLRVNGSQPYSKSLFVLPDQLPIEKMNKVIKFPISNITMQDPGEVGNTSFGCSTSMSHDITLVNVYVDLLVLTRIAGTS